MPIAPVPIDLLSTPVPTRNDPVNFRARADTLLNELPDMVAQTNTVSTTNYNNAVEAEANAAIAVSSASNATASASLAAASANFKGTWSSLTGALAKPATVLHNGFYYNLLNNLANVTTSQPGVTSDWALANSVARQIITVASGTQLATRFLTYLLTGNCTLTLPASPNVGDWVEVINNSNTITCTIASNSLKIHALNEDCIIDRTYFTSTVVYTGTTFGWLFI